MMNLTYIVKKQYININLYKKKSMFKLHNSHTSVHNQLNSKRFNIFAVSITSWHWHGTENWNPSSLKIRSINHIHGYSCHRFAMGQAISSYGIDLVWPNIMVSASEVSNWMCHELSLDRCLTYWGRDKMADISQTTFSNVFSSMKMFEFRLKFHWSLFLSVQLKVVQHWFR